MNNDKFESEMRKYELYHSIKVCDGSYPIIRVDGRSFSALTEKHYIKPFDINFHDVMTHVTKTLLDELDGVYAFTESDEISILLKRDTNLFDREVEKLVSISASIASVAFSIKSGIQGYFDARIWVGTSEPKVVDYFRWRQSDTTRCALNGWAYWTLRTAGYSARKASSILDQKSIDDKLKILFDYVIDFETVPAWQRFGTGLYWETYIKDGFNPITSQVVKVPRRMIKTDENLPSREAYSKFISDILGAESRDSVTIGFNS